MTNRRSFLVTAGIAPLGLLLPAPVVAQPGRNPSPAWTELAEHMDAVVTDILQKGPSAERFRTGVAYLRADIALARAEQVDERLRAGIRGRNRQQLVDRVLSMDDLLASGLERRLSGQPVPRLTRGVVEASIAQLLAFRSSLVDAWTRGADAIERQLNERQPAHLVRVTLQTPYCDFLRESAEHAAFLAAILCVVDPPICPAASLSAALFWASWYTCSLFY